MMKKTMKLSLKGNFMNKNINNLNLNYFEKIYHLEKFDNF